MRLQRIATRPFDPAEGLQGLQAFASGMFYQGTTLTAETSPYDFLKMADHVDDQVETVELTGGTIRYFVDDRTKFRFPYIVDIDGMDDVPANDFLEQRHWMMSLDALWCASQKFQGFGWNGYNYDAGSSGLVGRRTDRGPLPLALCDELDRRRQPLLRRCASLQSL